MKFSILTESKRKTIISIGAEATSDKTQYLIMIKTPSKVGVEKMYLKKTIPKTVLNGEKLMLLPQY